MKLYKDSYSKFWIANETSPSGTYSITFSPNNSKCLIRNIRTQYIIYNGLISELKKENGTSYINRTDLENAVSDFFRKASTTPTVETRGLEQYSTLTDFPEVGVTSLIYYTIDTKLLYVWNGVNYNLVPEQIMVDNLTVVDNYSALPDPTTVIDKFYWCSSSQGTSWLPGSLGGTYYNSGLYYSNGVTWEYLNVPYQATQAEVDAGTVTDKFVTPNTFNNASKWSNYSLTSHRHDGETITPDVVEFQTPASIPSAIGSTYYDTAHKVLSTVLDGAILQNGLELYVRVVNKTGAPINDGQAVYISGAQGNRPTATLAKADASVTSEVIGVATMNIPNNQEGFVTVFGSVDYNTTGITDGAELYLSGTVAGDLTETEPAFPLHKVVVATALNSTVNGKIFVRPFHVFELAELHGVDLTETTPLDTDSILIEQTSTGKVKKSLFTTLLTYIRGKANTWDLLQSFTSGAKLTKIVPISDTTGVVIRNAADTADLFKIDANGFQLDQYDDILPGMGWVDAAGGAAPDTAAHTIAGIAVNLKAFDGGTTTEAMTNAFEITHAIDIDALNRVTTPLLAEIHTHGMPATAGAGVVKIFYDLVYQPVNGAPIAWGTYSNLITINANEQYWHKLGGVELTKPSSGYNIGDQIIVKYYRVPTDAEDTYTGDWLFKQCAMHMPLNSNGSRQRYVK